MHFLKILYEFNNLFLLRAIILKHSSIYQNNYFDMIRVTKADMTSLVLI